MQAKYDLTKRVFGRLTVRGRNYSKPKGKGRYWDCDCSCGGTKTVLAAELCNGSIKSCGCSRTNPFPPQPSILSIHTTEQPSVSVRFFKHVTKTATCWEWNSGTARGGRGYGVFRYKTRVITAHRVAYMLYVGDIPPNLCVLHTCDNPKCVNPAHLFLGTQQDNMADRDNKNRQVRGERCVLSKLTESEVLSIRHFHKNGESGRQLARRYSVCHRTINRVIHRETWKHI